MGYLKFGELQFMFRDINFRITFHRLMKFRLKILLLIYLPVFALAQDSTIIISASDFDKSSDQVFLAKMNGWLFREGNNIAWAGGDVETGGWKKMKPVELSAKYADENGKMEGWFRIKIRISPDIKKIPLGIKISSWAASDLYINGVFISSFGSTGLNNIPYRELSPYGNFPLPVNLKPGNEYLIALHIVDYLSPLPPRRLKSEDINFTSLIRITGPAYSPLFLVGIKRLVIFTTIWVAVCTILSLLFWLLYAQNPLEKNLRLIALGTSFLALGIFFQGSLQNYIGLTYVGDLFRNFFAVLFIALTSITMPLILIQIFNRTINTPLKIFLALFLILFIVAGFISNNPGNMIVLGLLGILFGISIYYIVSSWKNLKGAQWSIVVGLLSSLTWALAFILASIDIPDNNLFFYVGITGYTLSFPLSLLFYVAIRFREIINETRQHAQQVVQLSEGKKEQALNQQKILQEEVDRQTTELKTTLSNLKATQSQLIQSEKMASLGELTAGIAHEIQNPLNFMNNFSEVNKELLIEMKDEIDKGNNNEVKSLADSVISNEEKINHHGRRAESIVKGMLEHSRSGVTAKEPKNINALADEYLRLSYHGFRAKEKSFNAKVITDYDPAIGDIHIIPQDMGRVFLNLFNNAFYAVYEKMKKISGDYEPTVSARTKMLNGKIEIRVRDNGNGIPSKLRDKIFQPFFTTKPPGQGTGLGLSLSYDIIKAHGGEIKVETSEGEFTEFIMQIQSA
jgi:two-component system, NtrC family, sensor kinase